MTSTPGASEPIYSTLASEPDLRELVGIFVDEMPERMSALLERFAASDWEGLRRIAHQLKGAAGSYGFDPISHSAAQLEDAIRQSQPEVQLLEMVEKLVGLCGRARRDPPN